MACCPTEKSYGYESCRFEKDVDESFHCSICYNVLKDPRACRNNDHMFCLDCITEHLKVNSLNCPECNEHLSVDTLRRPRVVNNYLSELKIKCDYASRGCPESVRVADLKSHVQNCGFAPVLCSNVECGMEINKLDKVHHESEVCEYRKVKCHQCGRIEEVVGRLDETVMELDKKVEAVTKMNKKVDTCAQEMKILKDNLNEMKIELKKEVKDVKENLSKVNTDVDEVKVMMIQMLEKLNMVELFNKLPSPTEEMMNTSREDILIAGGSGPLFNVKRSTEIYSWDKNGWFAMSEMNDAHTGASSFIYKDQLFVVGGEDSKTIETLDLTRLPLKWMKFPGKLPYASDDHQTVVYQQRVIHIGGYNYDTKKRSNVIGELQLTSPCAIEELCQMPEPRECHGAEIFEDKAWILGGVKGFRNVLDSVLKFDTTKNEVKEMPALPHALKRMATVRWRDQIVVLGGQDENDDILNDVFMYDCKTGKTTALPSMLEKRYRFCAIITGNTIVVMGGYGEKTKKIVRRRALESVECFTMGGSTWEYLPAMNEARYSAIAQVLPSTRKYV